MDLVSAEPATSRRSLIGALGIAGLASAAAVAVARPASAAPTDTEPPYSPTETDVDVLGPAMRVELAASRLYRTATEGLTDTAADVARIFGENHEAYADQYAAATGLSADAYDEAFYEEREADFATTDITQFAEAAWALENSLAATYSELFGQIRATQSQTILASIVVTNGRMATVLTDLAGVFDDLDAVFEPPSEIITFAEVPQS